MRKILALAALALAPHVAGQTTSSVLRLVTDYELDSATYVFPRLCSTTVGQPATCPGSGQSVSRPATTSGSASTTVTSVDSQSSFAGVAVGDELVFDLAGGKARRYVTAVATVNSITVDSNVTIPTAGASFSWFRREAAGGADDGYVSVDSFDPSYSIIVDVSQMNAASIDYKVECRACDERCASAVVVAGPANITAATSTRVNFSNEPWSQCRVGFKINTDDGGDTGANAEKITVLVKRGALQ